MKNENRRPTPLNQTNRKKSEDKHIVSVKYLDSSNNKFNDIIADSLEDALAFAKKLDDNPNTDYIIYDSFHRIVASKIRDVRKEYKYQKEKEEKEKKGKGHEEHGKGHGYGHDKHGDDDDMYA